MALRAMVPSLKADSIGRKFVLYIVLFTSAITLVETAAQLYRNYRWDVGRIRDGIEQLKESELNAISYSVWVSDTKMLEIQMEGLMRLPDMVHVQVTEEGKTLMKLGTPQASQCISRSFPLTYQYNGKLVNLGTLTVTSTLSGVYKRLADEFLIILITKAIKTAFVSFFIFLIFYQLVGRHLKTMANHARSLDIDHLDTPLVLERGVADKGRSDELEDLVRATNEMRESLALSLNESDSVQKALRESEIAFRSVFENSLDGMMLSAPDGSVFNANQAACEMLGYSEEELRQFGRAVVVDLSDSRVGAALEERARTGRFLGEINLLRKDGTVIPVELSSALFYDAYGQQKATLALRDLTQRKQLEEEYRRGEARLEKAQEIARLGSWEWDITTGIVSCSDETFRIFGYEPQEVELTYDLFMDAVHPDDRERIEAVLKDSLANGKRYDEEFRLVRTDGTVRILHSRGDIIAEVLGRPTAMIGAVLDITDRKMAEKALRESENLFRNVMENASVGVSLVGTDGRFARVNQKLCEILGYSEKELYQKSFNEVTHIEDQDIGVTFVRSAISGRIDSAGFEKRYIHKSGDVVWAYVSSTLYRNDAGEPQYFITHIQDITRRKQTEERLKASEERFRAVMDQAADAFFIHDMQGHIIDVNKKACENLGYSKEELLVKTVADIDPSANEKGVSEIWDRVKSGEYAALESYHRSKDGRSFPVEISLGAIQLGRETLILAIARDTTERKQAEEQLRLSEERYRELFERAKDAVFVTSPEGRVLDANQSFLDLFGYDKEELSALNMGDLYVDGADRDKALQMLGQDGYIKDLELSFRKNDGATMVCLATAVLRTDAEGRAVRFEGSLHDITDRKALEQDTLRLATAIEQSDESVMITDPNGEIVYVNPAFERTSGYTREEAVGVNPRILKSGEQDPEFYHVMWETLARGNTWSGNLVNRRKDGTIYEEEATISPVKNEQGDIVNYVAVKRDVTKEALLEKQLREAQKMQAIGTLTGGIAHDFNNLLQIIAGNAELLLMATDKTAAGHDELSAIHVAAERGSDLVKRMLTFGRRVEAKLEPMDLNNEIRQVEWLLYRTIPKMIDIELVLADDLRLVNGDLSQIEQVLINLAVNAKDAMPDGGRLLIETCNVNLDHEYCRLNPSVAPGPYVLLAVSDTGLGMERDVLERAFEPFFSTKQPDEGSGLGLSVVFGIVKLHGGHVKCYSEPGEGTMFKVYLPVAEEQMAPEEQRPTELATGGTETLLVVDDEELIRELAGKILSRAGYSVITAASGREALEIYGRKGSSISLVILDLIMPEMGGKQCLKALLDMDPEVKVLIASGFLVNGLSRGIPESGATGYVSKPFNMNEMLRSIRYALDEA